jgi:CRISPR-associated protein Cmr6
MPDPYQRPNPRQRPNSPQKPNQSTNPPQRRVITTGGNSGGNRGGGNNNNHNRGSGGNNNPPLPSPWLDSTNEPIPDSTASFVEYIRWMRSPDHQYKDATKTQILQLATEKANYNERLKVMKQRLELMSDETFQVKSSWRIRVGGHRGAENILLPAFDNLGIPFIPSASLRGVARNQAIREILKDDSEWIKLQNQLAKINPNNKSELEQTKKKIDSKWKEADLKISPIFGSLEAEKKDQAGKIVFFDAYPLADNQKGQHGLTMDMANNIWNWEGNELKYSPNPNVFLSLKEPTFLIGLKLASNQTNVKLLEQVKQWLIKGLESGIGSQINTGYGQLITAGKEAKINEFLRVEFALEGQLIHGHQMFTQWNWNDRRNEYQMRGKAEAEVRPVAFKSMLRYWFRVFANGVLNADDVKILEATLFGGINPQRNGYLKVNIVDSKLTQKEPQSKTDKCGEQKGILTLTLSNQVPQNQENIVKDLLNTVAWFMFNMGGIGQGARRPLYARNKRQNPKPPYYRGASLFSDNDFLDIPETKKELTQVFKQKLLNFYQNLQQLTGIIFNAKNLKNCGNVTQQNWSEAIDQNCRIVVVSGEENHGKCYALSILHSEKLKQNGNYDGNLCGFTIGNNVKPSPVWIADLGDYQIVTVFGATENPRRLYLETLKNAIQIFPLT